MYISHTVGNVDFNLSNNYGCSLSVRNKCFDDRRYDIKIRIENSHARTAMRAFATSIAAGLPAEVQQGDANVSFKDSKLTLMNDTSKSFMFCVVIPLAGDDLSKFAAMLQLIGA